MHGMMPQSCELFQYSFVIQANSLEIVYNSALSASGLFLFSMLSDKKNQKSGAREGQRCEFEFFIETNFLNYNLTR